MFNVVLLYKIQLKIEKQLCKYDTKTANLTVL